MKYVLGNRLGSTFSRNSGAESLCASLNYNSCMRKLRYLALQVVLFVMPMTIEHISHLQQLNVSFEFRCQVGPGNIEPVRPDVVILLAFRSAQSPRYENIFSMMLKTQSNYVENFHVLRREPKTGSRYPLQVDHVRFLIDER